MTAAIYLLAEVLFVVAPIYESASKGGRLPLFTELPRRGILGNWASDKFDSRNLTQK